MKRSGELDVNKGIVFQHSTGHKQSTNKHKKKHLVQVKIKQMCNCCKWGLIGCDNFIRSALTFKWMFKANTILVWYFLDMTVFSMVYQCKLYILCLYRKLYSRIESSSQFLLFTKNLQGSLLFDSSDYRLNFIIIIKKS